MKEEVYYVFNFIHFASHFRFQAFYLMDIARLPVDIIGVVLSLSRLMTNGAGPLWSIIADRTKAGRTVLLSTTVISLCLFVGMIAFVSENSVSSEPIGWSSPITVGLLVIYCVLHFFKGSHIPVGDALIMLQLHDVGKHAEESSGGEAAGNVDPESNNTSHEGVKSVVKFKWSRARFYGVLAWGLAHLAFGPLFYYFPFGNVYTTLMIASGVLYMGAIFFCLPGKQKTKELVEDGPKTVQVNGEVALTFTQQLWKVLKSPTNLVFFTCLLVCGGSFNMFENLLLVALKDVYGSSLTGSPQEVARQTYLVSSIAVFFTIVPELPIFFWGDWILNTALKGDDIAIFLGILSMTLRATLYAILPLNLTTLLILEPLHGVTFGLVYMGAVHKTATDIATPETAATCQSLFQFFFAGLGPLIFTLASGFLLKRAGHHLAFGVTAILLTFATSLYAFYFLYYKRQNFPGAENIQRFAEVVVAQ